MRASVAMFGLLAATAVVGLGGCGAREEVRPAAPAVPSSSEPVAAEPTAGPAEDTVVAWESETLGALEVRSPDRDPADWFEVLRDGQRAVPGAPRRLNGSVELPPGTYEVVVNRTPRTVEVQAGEKTVLWTGELVVEGEPDTASWYPMQGDDRRLSANPPTLNTARSFFPGSYTVYVHFGVQAPNANLGEAEVVAGQRTVIHHP